MHFDSWFFYFTLTYSGLALALLPFIGCSHVFACPADPPPPADGHTLSVSTLIHRVPLATSYAYAGALFLFAVVYCQSDSQRDNAVSVTRFLASFLSAKFLAIPLILPLDSIKDSWVHDTFFILGGVCEVLVCLIVWYEKKHRSWLAWPERVLMASTGAMLSAVVAAGCVAYNHPHNAGVYTLLALEYLFGISLGVNAFVTHHYQF